MSCGPGTKRCASAKPLNEDTPECCIAHVTALLVEIRDAFAEAGVRWWLDYGSLLGVVRNPILGSAPGMIPWDKDGDAGFLAEDWPLVAEVFGLEPWDWRRSHGRMLEYDWAGRSVQHKLPRQTLWGAGDSLKVRLSRKNHTNVDLYPWYGCGDGVRTRLNYVGIDMNKGREFPEDRLLPLATATYDGHLLPVPADPEWFCRHRYGPSWREPLRRNNAGVPV